MPTWTNDKPLTPATDCEGNSTIGASVEVLIVAGGGGGGSRHGGGGGGGGLIYSPGISITNTSYPVVVGAGGSGTVDGAIANQDTATNGSNSSAFGLVAVGGGAGRGSASGLAGGSGGGGGAGGGSVGGANTSGQGNAGGAGIFSTQYMGGGGGGAGAVGQNAVYISNPEPSGGAGVSNSITGSSVTYAAGGRGANYSLQTTSVAGVANTGNGGGGAGGNINAGGAGGSGVVIISYPTNSGISATGGSITTSGGDTIHRFTGSGTFTVTSLGNNLCLSNPQCFVSVNGNIRSSFSVGLPTLDSDGRALTIPQNGFVELVRESTGVVWRTYRQPSAQPTVAPGLCSGAATSSLGWSTAVLTTSGVAFPEPLAQVIGIAPGAVNPGPLFFRKDFSITDPGVYTLQVKGNDRVDLYIDGMLTTRTPNISTTNTVDIELTEGCHTVAAIAFNAGVTASPASIEFALRKKDAPIPILVSDRTWRVAVADTVSWASPQYYQNVGAWAPVRDIAAYNASPWTGGPGNWLTITNDASARWISTDHSFSGNNYPFASNAYFRSNNVAAWTFTAATEVQIAAACDDVCNVYIDGNQVLQTSGWSVTGTATVTLSPGAHQVSIELQNAGVSNNASGFLFSARRVSNSVVFDRSSTNWSAASSWFSASQSFASYNASFRPTPDVTRCNCPTEGVSNLVSNPSFETNLDGVTTNLTNVTRSSAQSFSGTFSARGSVTSSSGKPSIYVRINDVEPGVRYRVSSYYFAPASKGLLKYDFFDRTGVRINGGSFVQSSAQPGWSRFSLQTVFTPVGTEYMRIEVGIDADSSIGSLLC